MTAVLPSTVSTEEHCTACGGPERYETHGPAGCVIRLRRERDGLRLERDDALEGLESAMNDLDAARAKIAAVCELLAENGCDCECDHHPEEHNDDCVRCFGCKVSAIVDPHPTRDPK